MRVLMEQASHRVDPGLCETGQARSRGISGPVRIALVAGLLGLSCSAVKPEFVGYVEPTATATGSKPEPAPPETPAHDAGTSIPRNEAEPDAGCARGEFSVMAKGSTCKQHQTCAAGTFVEADGNATEDRRCSECPAGTFSIEENSAACLPWTACLHGSFILTPGTPVSDQACAECIAGSFAASSNASKCEDWQTCLAGSYVSSPGTTSTDRTCTLCKAGEYSDAMNAVACRACPLGQISEPGAIACTTQKKQILVSPGLHRPGGGVVSFDAACQASFGGATSVWKALVVGGGRRATVTPNTGDGQTDWVIQKHTEYYNAAGQLIWVTDDAGLLGVSAGKREKLLAPVTDHGAYPWSGFSDDWTTIIAKTCVGWTSTEASGEGAFAGRYLEYLEIEPCDRREPLVCVEQ